MGHDRHCFLPPYVFCGHQLLAAYLRPGNSDGARHAWAVLALLVNRLCRTWPGGALVPNSAMALSRFEDGPEFAVQVTICTAVEPIFTTAETVTPHQGAKVIGIEALVQYSG